MELTPMHLGAEEDCDELLEDRHNTSVTFVCADDGTWYVQPKFDMGAYTASSWFRVDDADLSMTLEELLLAARDRDRAF